MRIGYAVDERRVQDCEVFWSRNGVSGLTYLDLPHHDPLSEAVRDRPSAVVRPDFCDWNVP